MVYVDSGVGGEKPVETGMVSRSIKLYAEPPERPGGLIRRNTIRYAAAEALCAVPEKRELNPGPFGRKRHSSSDAGSSLRKIDSSPVEAMALPGQQTGHTNIDPVFFTPFPTLSEHYYFPRSLEKRGRCGPPAPANRHGSISDLTP